MARAAARARGVGVYDRAASTVTIALVRREKTRRGGRPTHRRGIGEHNERPEVIIVVPHELEADGTPRPRGHVLRGRRSCSSRERANAVGLVVSLIS
jgi:hypothetical protein